MNYLKPHIIDFHSIGSTELGYISVAQYEEKIPFEIKRVYWTYYTPQSVIRGGHANIEKEMILIAVAGKIEITTETKGGVRDSFILDQPHQGLYLPKLCWHSMKYSHNAVQLVIASNNYSSEDYIRDYQTFLSYEI